MSDTKQLEPLKGEGERKTMIRVRRECEECGELATVKYSYLLPRARGNPASSAYRRDDCSWCSDLDVFLCFACDERQWHPHRDGYEPCSRFYDARKYPHIFLEWRTVQED